jgi:hypothetical protein
VNIDISASAARIKQRNPGVGLAGQSRIPLRAMRTTL